MGKTGSIKAIETVYNGYRFRSRLEARWAVFFDALGIQYEYEPEGYDLGEAGWYMPDFWLPDHKCWIEIKGTEPTIKQRKKAYLLSSGVKQAVFIQYKSPGVNRFIPDDDRYLTANNKLEVYAGEAWDMWEVKAWSNSLWEYTFDDEVLPRFLQEKYPDKNIGLARTTQERKDLIKLDIEYYQNRYDKTHPKWLLGRHEKDLQWYLSDTGMLLADHFGVPIIHHSQLVNAYLAARQARFEHGEKPITSRMLQQVPAY